MQRAYTFSKNPDHHIVGNFMQHSQHDISDELYILASLTGDKRSKMLDAPAGAAEVLNRYRYAKMRPQEKDGRLHQHTGRVRPAQPTTAILRSVLVSPLRTQSLHSELSAPPGVDHTSVMQPTQSLKY
jgi:hypothetical protein